MALRGSLSTNKYKTSSLGTIGLILTWTATQDVINNTTRIYYTLESNGTMPSGSWVYAGPVTLTINGVKLINQTERFQMHGDGGYRRTGNLIIAHNVDGSKTVSMLIKAAIYSTSVNCTATKSFTLDKIDRGALITSAESFTDEGNPTIEYTNPAGTDLCNGLKARITWNDGENYTDWVTLNDEGGTYTFNLSSADRAAMLAACTDSPTLAVKFDLYSLLNGSEFHNYKDAVMTVVNANPTGGTFTYADANSAVVAITGDNQVIVQGKSSLNLNTAGWQGQKGATISSVAVTVNEQSYTPDENGDVLLGVISTAGTLTALLTVTDSRGYKTELTLSVPISELSMPTAIISWARVNNFEPTTILNVDGKISNFSGNTLSQSAKYRKIETPAGSWTEIPNVPDAQDVTILNVDNEYEWEMEITVSDSFNSVIFTIRLSKGIPFVFFDTDLNSVGINGFPDDSKQLLVDGTVKATGDIEADGVKLHDKIQQVTLTQNVSMSSASGYFQLSDNLDYPRNDAILIGMQAKTSQIGATAGTIYQLIYWENGAKPYIQYQRGSSSFSNVSYDFIFTFYLP